MNTTRLVLILLLATLAPRHASADLVGPYTADANTLYLFHFDEAAGGTVTTNLGSKAGNSYSVTEAVASATPATVTTMLGAAGYVNGATNFNNCMTNPTTGYVFGYDGNNSGAYQGEGAAPCPDAIAMTNLNIGNGGQSSFTIEALVRPNAIAAATGQEIVCTDSSSTRAFQFRIISGTLQFQFINGSQALSGTIPTTGGDAFAAGNWYHVAMVYNGTTASLYWTPLSPTNGAAHLLNSGSLTLGTTQGATTGPLCIGNENRSTAGEQFQGCIDEVRISNVARAANQMQFFSPLVTITANPVSQNIDYNQPVTLSVGASSLTALSYQWRYNSNTYAGFTNSAFTITNVAAGDAGFYDCIVTNTAGFAATSSPALLKVGAANFLANRYSFTNDTTDSIGGQTGTNFGAAVVTNGSLVLDGTSGTYMRLPGSLFNAANATALTVEFWATYGVNPNNVYAFAFGVTNFVTGQGVIGFNFAHYTPHNAGGQTASAAPGDPLFAQSVNAAGNLDGRTVHVAVVFDPPTKQLSIYTNGVLEAVNTNFTVNISSLNDQLSYIGRSLWVADPYLNASIDEIRIFKGALSPITIKQSDDQGPNVLLADGPPKFVLNPASISVPTGHTASFSASAVGYLPITYQWFTNGAPIAGATNANVSFTALIGLNGATVLCKATNTIGVTTYISNSLPATLTVFTPPTLTWSGGANSQWNTADANWNVNTTIFAQTNGATFDAAGSGFPIVDLIQSILPYEITVNAASDYTFTSSGANGALTGASGINKQNTGKLIIDVTNNLSGPVTISGGTVQVGNGTSFGSLGTGVVTNNGALAFNRSDTALNVGNAIRGTGTVSFDGLGTVTVSGNSDYSGNTEITNGIVVLTSSTGLGSASSGTVATNGGQLYITANVNVAEGLTLGGAGALRKGGAGLTVDTAPVVLAADTTITVDGGATLTLSNLVSGPFAVTAIGGGVLALNTNNSFTGGLTLNGAVVGLNANGALGPAPATVSGTGRFVLGDGVNIANPIHATVVNAGSGLGLVMVNDNTNGTVTTASGPLTFDASPTAGGNFIGPASSGYLHITGKVTNSITGVISSRAGNVRFSGGGDYTLFTLNQGTVSLGANNGLCPSASLTIAASAAATFDLNGFNQALTGITDGGANPELVTNSSPTPGTLTFNLTAANTYSGSLAGALSLVVNGTGGLTVSSNSYTGNTTVNGGTLDIALATLGTNSAVTVASAGVLNLAFAVTNQVGSLVLNGANQPAGIYGAGTSAPYLTGAGSLLVAAPAVNTTPTNLVSSVSGGTLTLNWPADHIGWKLQAQTNSRAIGLATNWVDIGGTAATNSYSTAINPTNGTVFYRMVYP